MTYWFSRWLSGMAIVISITAMGFSASTYIHSTQDYRESKMTAQIRKEQNQITGLKVQENRLRAKLLGSSRDVLTCNDFLNMGLDTYWQDSNYNLQSSPISLPGHCINQ